MLSYQWDVQDRVIATREILTRSGVPCWMDVDGGMDVDICAHPPRAVDYCLLHDFGPFSCPLRR